MSGDRKLHLWSGVGLCAATMIGSGVFLSAGFMAQDMSPGAILLAWLVGGALSALGAVAFAEVAMLVPRSGGEYRYLSELAHPAVGYIAGWCSVLLGMAAPVAINALAAAAFLGTLVPIPDAKLVAAGLIVVLTIPHAARFEASKWTQNLLVLAKVLLLGGFLVVGLFLGETSWPTWEPPSGDGGGSLAAFMVGLLYVSYAFSGWNTTAYSAEEFSDPRRDVARSMVIAAVAVALYYAGVNWIFVANLSPEAAAVVVGDESGVLTLGHVVAADLLGPWGGKAMSVLATIAFLSAMSAMIFSGPRVAAQMAKDGYLPKVLAGEGATPPAITVIAQSAVTVALLWGQSARDMLSTVGAILTIFTALVAACLLWSRYLRPELPRPRVGSQIAAAIYVAFSIWMLYFAFRDQASLLPWLAAVIAVALGSYALTRRATSRSR